MGKEKGFLSIESKNVFSILKKWLYTEKEIVFRELISNASDAIEKLSALREMEKTGLKRIVIGQTKCEPSVLAYYDMKP